ncbi:hypothetical protein [Stagnihabitans tardus]|uniref:Uncharacterized protein n=1 Tax=Stagnihabitans tardus TaxID=2699202 RepID=A0AAE4Y8R7_9RHOB|nr:hypothetical protein [Stagnihabitans tardus]NBZ88033.1 hypothetical protein [Stagnihabitans tardus]
MRYILILGLLAACDASPHWQMAGAESTRVTVDGHDYAVYRKDKTFEVIRYGWAPRSEQDTIYENMLLVVQQVTGCTPHVLSGDSGEMRGKLTSCSR